MSVGARVFMVAAALAVAVPLATRAHSDSLLQSASTDIQLQFADLLFGDGRFDEAADAYERVRHVEDRQQRARALTGLVNSVLRTAEFLRAHAAADALRTTAPSDPDAISLHGDALWAAGRFQQSEAAMLDALALDPGHARAHHGLARVLAGRHLLDESLRHVEAALATSPRDAELYHTLASLYARMHRFQDAADALSSYISLLPRREDGSKAAWARSEMRFLRSFGSRVPYDIPPEQRDVIHTIPFRIVRDKIVVRASVNRGPQMDFVVDTGAEQTVLSQRVAQRAGVVPIAQTLAAGVGSVGLRNLQVGRIDRFQIGSLTISNIPALIKNPALSGLPNRESESFSPLAFGLSMLVDYDQRRLLIARDLPVEPADIELPLHVYRLPMVQGLVDEDHPVSFIVDTGGVVISLSTTTAEILPARNVRRIPLRVYGTSGWDPDAFLLPGVRLEFETIDMANIPVVVMNLQAPSALLGFQIGGTVGHRFLSRYRVGIDLQRSVLRLTEPRNGTAIAP